MPINYSDMVDKSTIKAGVLALQAYIKALSDDEVCALAERLIQAGDPLLEEMLRTEHRTIPIVRRSFWDEFKHPLDKVERNWLRRGALLIITLVAIPLGAIAGVIELVRYLYKDCW